MSFSGGNDNKLCVWSLKSNEPVLKFNQHQAAVKARGATEKSVRKGRKPSPIAGHLRQRVFEVAWRAAHADRYHPFS